MKKIEHHPDVRVYNPIYLGDVIRKQTEIIKALNKPITEAEDILEIRHENQHAESCGR